MAMRKDCPKCQGTMTEGVIVEHKDGTRIASSWLEGPVEKGWLGLKMRGKSTIDVVTYRCGRCGFLENYAPGT